MCEMVRQIIHQITVVHYFVRLVEYYCRWETLRNFYSDLAILVLRLSVQNVYNDVGPSISLHSILHNPYFVSSFPL